MQNEFKKALIALFTMKLIYCHTRQRLDDPPWAILRLTVRHEYHKVHKNKVILTGNRNILQGLTSFLRPTGGALEELWRKVLLRDSSIPFYFTRFLEKVSQRGTIFVLSFYENLVSNFKSHTTLLQLIIIYLGVLISQISLFICYIRQKNSFQLTQKTMLKKKLCHCSFSLSTIFDISVNVLGPSNLDIWKRGQAAGICSSKDPNRKLKHRYLGTLLIVSRRQNDSRTSPVMLYIRSTTTPSWAIYLLSTKSWNHFRNSNLISMLLHLYQIF